MKLKKKILYETKHYKLIIAVLVVIVIGLLLTGNQDKKVVNKPVEQTTPTENSMPPAKTKSFAGSYDYSIGDGSMGSDIWGLPYPVDRNVDPIIGTGSLNETNLQKATIGIRFTSMKTGNFQKFVTYWISNTGAPGAYYSGGTGGRIQIRLYEATAGGTPQGFPLDEIDFIPGLVGAACLPTPGFAPTNPCSTAVTPAYQAQHSAPFIWPNSPAIVTGGRYIITWENIDPNPNINYIRLQFNALAEDAADNPDGYSYFGLGEGFTRDRLGFSYKLGSGAWTSGETWDNGGGTRFYDPKPVIGIKMTDGSSFGEAGWFPWNNHQNYNFCGLDTYCDYNSASPKGEQFIPDKALNVTKLYTALSPKTGGTVTLSLRRASDAFVMGQCNITTPTLDQTSANQYHGYVRSRSYSCVLPSTLVLDSGVQYQFLIQGVGSANGSMLLNGDMTKWPFSTIPMGDMLGASIDGTYYNGGTIPHFDVVFGLKLTTGSGATTTTSTTTTIPGSVPATPVTSGLVFNLDMARTDKWSSASSLLTSVTDITSNAAVATPTGAERPTIVTDATSGYNAAQFSNATFLTFPHSAALTPSEVSIFFAGNITPSGVFKYVVNKSSGANGYAFMRTSGSDGTARFEINGGTMAASPTTPTGRMYVSQIRSATTHTGRINGTEVTSAASGSIASNTAPLYIGACCGAAGNNVAGSYFEVLIYNRALNSTEVGQVETYLNNKWGLTVTPPTTTTTTTTTTSPASTTTTTIPAVSPETACSGAITIEAETANNIIGTVPIVGSYREQFNVATAVGHTFTVPSSGNYTIQTRHYNTITATRTLYLSPGSGGTSISTLPQVYSGGITWSTVSESVSLLAGTQTVSISYEAYNSGNILIDYIRLCPKVPATTTTTTSTTTTTVVGATTTTVPVTTTTLGPETCSGVPSATYYSSGIIVDTITDENVNTKSVAVNIKTQSITITLDEAQVISNVAVGFKLAKAARQWQADVRSSLSGNYTRVVNEFTISTTGSDICVSKNFRPTRAKQVKFTFRVPENNAPIEIFEIRVR